MPSLLKKAGDIALPYGSANSWSSVVLFTFVSIILGFTLTIFFEWMRGGRNMSALKTALTTWPSYLSAVIVAFLLWGGAYSVAVVKTVIQDESLFEQMGTLDELMRDELQAYARELHKRPRIFPMRPSATFPDPSLRRVDDVVTHLQAIHSGLSSVSPISFVITAPRENFNAMVMIGHLLNGACRQSPQLDCSLANGPDLEVVLDSGVPPPSRRGIVIHGPDELPNRTTTQLTATLSSWFVAHSTAEIPEGMKKYNLHNNKTFLWIEIGKGSPWK